MKKVLYLRVCILRPFLVDLIAFFQEGKTVNKVKLKCNYACFFFRAMQFVAIFLKRKSHQFKS